MVWTQPKIAVCFCRNIFILNKCEVYSLKLCEKIPQSGFFYSGANRLMDDIEHMVGFRLGKHWYICWKFITPLLLIVSFYLSGRPFSAHSVIKINEDTKGWSILVNNNGCFFPFVLQNVMAQHLLNFGTFCMFHAYHFLTGKYNWDVNCCTIRL